MLADWKFAFMRRQAVLHHNKLFFAPFVDGSLETLNFEKIGNFSNYNNCCRCLLSCLTLSFLHDIGYIEEYIKLSNDGNLKLQCTNQILTKFWINVQNAYTCTTLAREALKKFLVFATTYLCETMFSHYVLTKLK